MTASRTMLAALSLALLILPAAPARAQDQSSLREAHGDWEVRCREEGARCFMTQTFLNDKGAPVVVFSVIVPPDLTDDTGAKVPALAELVVPFGVFLPAGLGIRVDNGDVRSIPYEICDGPGCRAIMPMGDGAVLDLKRGGVAYISVARDPERVVEFPISLSGFTAAFNSL